MPRVSRLGIIHGALALFAAAIVAKAAHVQLWQGASWAARAQSQHFADKPVPAPRGDILDASGNVVVQSRELVTLHVAPKELRDPRALRKALARAGVSAQWAARAVDRKRQWVSIPGRFVPTEVATIVAMRGVYPRAVSDRVHFGTQGLERIVGRVGPDGEPVDGIELALDTLLEGRAGTATLVRDARGRKFESPTVPGTAPRKGHTVVLTINAALQDIAERALGDAAAKMGATGGDIVLLDPHSGAVLAMASRRADPRATASTALTEPFEPGSTLKPFVAAALLEKRKARADEVVSTHGGRWTRDGRTITDVHREDRMTLTEVIRFSSNIGIVQFAERLTPREEYEMLRDAGFGAPTGVPYPSEASGLLRHPRGWSRTSHASLAMGYELSVTPLQLAAAYASFANGGELVEPQLVREVRDADGAKVWTMSRRPVRRLMSPETSEIVRQMLEGVVSEGTASGADLATFAVAGKTGTARRVEGGRYAAGKYTATFVGLFPSNEPQYVLLVKLDNPQGEYYGGTTAAPVSRVVLEAAIAARDASLDRGALASRSREANVAAARPSAESVAALAAANERVQASAHQGSVPYMVALTEKPAAAPARRARAVPDVQGMPLRDAVHTLHRAGFRVQLVPGASNGATQPAPGTVLAPGATVRLSRER